MWNNTFDHLALSIAVVGYVGGAFMPQDAVTPSRTIPINNKIALISTFRSSVQFAGEPDLVLFHHNLPYSPQSCLPPKPNIRSG